MKKQYIRISIVICVLILVAMILGCGFFTYVQVQRINTEYMDICAANSDQEVISFTEDTELAYALRSTYSYAWHNAATALPKEIGFYGRFNWVDGDKQYVDSSDFIRVYYLSSGVVRDNDQVRILVLDEAIQGVERTGDLQNINITADSDDVFLYNGNLSFDNPNGERTVYAFGAPEQVSAPVGGEYSSWTDGKALFAEYVRMAQDPSQTKLNREAKNTYEKETLNFTSSHGMQMKKAGWFTSYYICAHYTAFDVSTPKTAVGVYVYHPVEIVAARYSYVYILFAIVLLAMEAMVIFVMHKMYITRRNYELRSQKLTRSIAHELKTPLAVTKAYVENWEYFDEGEREKISGNINAEVDHMTQLVNSLLNLSKMDTGTVELHPEEVELLSLARAVYHQMEPLAKERGLQVLFKQDEEGAEYCVTADLEMIRMAVGNYISNAIKYAEKHVSIELEKTGKTVMFRVRNDGEGIPKKEQKRIWELFYKTDKARTDRLGSSGVGLAVTKSILELHKAKYGCTSDATETVFWFEMKKGK